MYAKAAFNSFSASIVQWAGNIYTWSLLGVNGFLLAVTVLLWRAERSLTSLALVIHSSDLIENDGCVSWGLFAREMVIVARIEAVLCSGRRYRHRSNFHCLASSQSPYQHRKKECTFYAWRHSMHAVIVMTNRLPVTSPSVIRSSSWEWRLSDSLMTEVAIDTTHTNQRYSRRTETYSSLLPLSPYQHEECEFHVWQLLLWLVEQSDLILAHCYGVSPRDARLCVWLSLGYSEASRAYCTPRWRRFRTL